MCSGLSARCARLPPFTQQVGSQEDNRATAETVDMHLNMLRGAVAAYGGSVEVVGVEAGVVTLNYKGPLPIGYGLRAAVRDKFPDIVEVGGGGVQHAGKGQQAGGGTASVSSRAWLSTGMPCAHAHTHRCSWWTPTRTSQSSSERRDAPGPARFSLPDKPVALLLMCWYCV